MISATTVLNADGTYSPAFIFELDTYASKEYKFKESYEAKQKAEQDLKGFIEHCIFNLQHNGYERE